MINSVNLFFDKNTYINQFMGAGGVGQAIDDFNADNFDHSSLGFIGGGVIWGRQTGNGPVRGIPVPSGTPNWGSPLEGGGEGKLPAHRAHRVADEQHGLSRLLPRSRSDL